MRKLLWLSLLLFLLPARTHAQTNIQSGPTDPTFCTPGAYFYNTTSATYRQCNSANTWAASGGGITFPAGQTPNTRSIFAGDAKYALPISASVSWGTGLTMTNGSQTVTCTGANCTPWQASDVGSIIFGTNGCCSTTPAPGGIVTMALTTITGFNSATSITVSVAPTNTCTGSIQCIVVWAKSKSTTALNAAWTDVTGGFDCNELILPAGLYLYDSSLFNTTATNCGSQGIVFPTFVAEAIGGNNIVGQGVGVTILIPTPDFNFASCTGGSSFKSCFGGGAGQGSIRDFSIWGAGNSLSGQTHDVELLGPNSINGIILERVRVVNWGGSDTSARGILIPSTATQVISFNAGSVSCQMNSTSSMQLSDSYCGNSIGASLVIAGGVMIHMKGNIFGQVGNNNPTVWIKGTAATRVISAGDFIGYGNPSTNSSIQCDGGNVDITGDDLTNSNTTGISLTNAACTMVVRSSVFNSSVAIARTGGTYIDGGNNTWTAGTFTATGATGFIPYKSVSGSCTGVATATSTLGLYGTGPNETLTTCTSAAIGTGIVMDHAGTLGPLLVTVTAAGTNASSGVVTVLINGAGSTSTCTVGTGTSCVDGTHFPAFVAGDKISLQFTTQAADTLAGVKATIGEKN